MRGIAVPGLHEPVIESGGEEHDRLRPGRLDNEPCVGGHSRPPREHAEVHGLEVREGDIRSADEHHRLARRDPVAVAQRQHLDVRPLVSFGETRLQDGDGFVHSAEPGILLLEHLHRDLRVPAAGDQDVARADEVLVRVVTGADALDGKPKLLGRNTLCRSERGRDCTRRHRPSAYPRHSTTVYFTTIVPFIVGWN